MLTRPEKKPRLAAPPSAEPLQDRALGQDWMIADDAPVPGPIAVADVPGTPGVVAVAAASEIGAQGLRPLADAGTGHVEPERVPL